MIMSYTQVRILGKIKNGQTDYVLVLNTVIKAIRLHNKHKIWIRESCLNLTVYVQIKNFNSMKFSS